ncbi:cytochrome P450 [Exidia glandulosa HHB12029]|uniref:Cytochrome P450 n=1 Tax=Exidia glandulosa HHB12029 TaxID=1314781 RepID=A0A165J4H6_EXIGL|nr:cytochrome P450 [Exidia glandulosa HHB12029]
MLQSNISPALGLTVCAGVWLAARLLRPSRASVPPGPPGRPLLGNLLDFPKEKEWLKYAEWAKQYGDIISVNVLGQTVVVLHSAKDVKELFVNRASSYSARIRMTMVQLAGWEVGTATVSPGEQFRAMRRFMSQILSGQAVKGYIDVEEQEITTFLRLAIRNGSGADMKAQIQRMAAAIDLRLTYGYNIKTDADEFKDLAEHALRIFNAAAQPGWVVDAFPFLRFIPTWFPFASFKRKAVEWRKVVEASRQRTLDWTRSQVETGTAVPCFATQLLADPERMEQERMFQVVLADLFMAGVDTVTVAAAKLFLALATHPEAQARAQGEIDALTKGERLPTYEDKQHLPYLDALLKEVHRWDTPIAPLALPHCASEEDMYKGYRIPKDAIVFANVWAIFRNPEKYPDPDTFKPERFLEKGERQTASRDIINEDPYKFAFGFGARICPGRHLADSAQFLLAAKLLATCTVSNAVDMQGQRLSSRTIEFSPGVVSQPPRFTCTVEPRSPQAEGLLFEGAN